MDENAGQTPAGIPACPHCGSGRVGSWNRPESGRRFRCGACGRTFNRHTGTPLARLRKRDLWPLMEEAIKDGLSLREAAKRCGVSLPTAFKWRHRFQEQGLKREMPEKSEGQGTNPAEPHWERGDRCHGLWRGDARVGLVSLGPRGLWDGVYLWRIDRSAGSAVEEGTAPTLASAKRIVERKSRAAQAREECG